MIKTTQWSPDTCECKLEYEWDTEDTKPNKTFTGRNVINACSRHAGGSPNSVFGKVLADNNAKNNTIKVLTANFPVLTKTDDEGNVKIRQDAFSYVLREDRVYEITISDLNSEEKIQAQSLINDELGDVDKVIIM